MLGRIRQLGIAIDSGVAGLVALCAALSAVFPIGVPLLLGRIIDAALHGATLLQLLPLLGLMLLLAALGAGTELVSSIVGARIGYGLAWQLAGRLYGALLRMPL